MPRRGRNSRSYSRTRKRRTHGTSGYVKPGEGKYAPVARSLIRDYGYEKAHEEAYMPQVRSAIRAIAKQEAGLILKEDSGGRRKSRPVATETGDGSTATRNGQSLSSVSAPPPPPPRKTGGDINWKWVSGGVIAVIVAAMVFLSGNSDDSAIGSSLGSGSYSSTPVSQSYGSGSSGPQYNGYRVVCRDGWISHSGGRQGACSHHGGVSK